jgi:hypothetical protein
MFDAHEEADFEKNSSSNIEFGELLAEPFSSCMILYFILIELECRSRNNTLSSVSSVY